MAAPEHRRQIAVHGIEAHWALFSKHPRQFDDYSVIAASSGPVSANQFQRLIVRSSPGSPPPPHETGAAALPWVWFVPFSLKNTAYVGVAVREWTDYTDGTNRPVASTRFICLPLAQVIARPVRLTDLYRAVSTAELAWDEGNPHAAAPFRISLTVSTSDTVVERIRTIGLDQVAGAAVRLFEGTVALLGGGPDIEARLADLDAITALLPAGARTWLAASSWADSGTQHPHHLTFAQRARDNDFPVDLRPGGRVADGQRSPYEKELASLCSRHGVLAVVEHLRTVTDLVERDAYQAEERLRDLDLLGTVREQLSTGSLRRHLVRRLADQGLFGELLPSEQEEVLCQLLDTATSSDLTAERDLFRRYWSSSLNGRLTTVTSRRLWEQGWTADQLATLAGLAQAVHAMDSFAGGLVPPGNGHYPRVPAVRQLAGLVVHLARDVDWQRLFGPVVVHSTVLSVAVIDVLLRTNPGLDETWLDQYAGSYSDWGRVSDVYRQAMSDTGHVDEAQLSLLNTIDEDAVPALVRTTQNRQPASLGRLMSSVLPFFERIYAATMPPSAEQLLRGMSLGDQRQLAHVDFLLCRAGGVPPSRPEARRDYWTHFLDFVREANMSRVDMLPLVRNVASGLGTGWALSATSPVVLDALWKLGELASSTAVLARLVADEAVSYPRLLDTILDHPELAPWLSELERDPRLEHMISQQRLRNLPPSASASDVAAIVRELLMRGADPAELVAALSRSNWQPETDDLAALIFLVGVRWRRNQNFGMALGEALVRGHFGPAQTTRALEHLPILLLYQQVVNVQIIRTAAESEDPRGRAALARVADDLQTLQRQLEDLAKLVKGNRGNPLTRVFKGSGDDRPKHAGG